jgi:endogenous inhibitor of DNA gyrase (YacG/DUF329 family)
MEVEMRGNGSVPLTCAHCGAAFIVPGYRAQTAHYCGRACADLGHRGRPSPKDQRVTLHCEACGAAFKVKAGRAAERRFCSMACSAKHQRRVLERPRDASKREMRSCRQCGAAFEYWAARAHPFCSKRCYVAHLRAATPETFWASLHESALAPAACPDMGQCWLWTGSTYSNGYGIVSYGGQRYLAHRLAWELTYGPPPADLLVLHHCDVRPCCNPVHLYVGTGTDNNNDMWSRGRRTHSVRLTEDQVWAIRAQYRLRTGSDAPAYGDATYELAVEFSVSPTTIYDIVSRRTWSHL